MPPTQKQNVTRYRCGLRKNANAIGLTLVLCSAITLATVFITLLKQDKMFSVNTNNTTHAPNSTEMKQGFSGISYRVFTDWDKFLKANFSLSQAFDTNEFDKQYHYIYKLCFFHHKIDIPGWN